MNFSYNVSQRYVKSALRFFNLFKKRNALGKKRRQERLLYKARKDYEETGVMKFTPGWYKLKLLAEQDH